MARSMAELEAYYRDGRPPTWLVLKGQGKFLKELKKNEHYRPVDPSDDIETMPTGSVGFYKTTVIIVR